MYVMYRNSRMLTCVVHIDQICSSSILQKEPFISKASTVPCVLLRNDFILDKQWPQATTARHFTFLLTLSFWTGIRDIHVEVNSFLFALDDCTFPKAVPLCCRTIQFAHAPISVRRLVPI